MLARGLPSSFFRIRVPAVAVYGIFVPFTVISCLVRVIVSTGGAGSGFGAGGGVCAARSVNEKKVNKIEVFIEAAASIMHGVWGLLV